MMSLRQLLSEAADEAKGDMRPAPVIETDFATAHLIAKALAAEIGDITGCRLPPDHPEVVGFGVVAMYDGVKIKGKRW